MLITSVMTCHRRVYPAWNSWDGKSSVSTWRKSSGPRHWQRPYGSVIMTFIQTSTGCWQWLWLSQWPYLNMNGLSVVWQGLTHLQATQSSERLDSLALIKELVIGYSFYSVHIPLLLLVYIYFTDHLLFSSSQACHFLAAKHQHPPYMKSAYENAQV